MSTALAKLDGRFLYFARSLIDLYKIIFLFDYPLFE